MKIIVPAALLGGLLVACGWRYWPRGPEAHPTPDPTSEMPIIADASSETDGAPPARLAADTEPAPPRRQPSAPPRDEVLEPSGGAPPPVAAAQAPTIASAAQPSVSAPASAPASVTPATPTDEPQVALTTPEPSPGADVTRTEIRVSSSPRIESAMARYRAGQALDARRELNELLAASRDPGEQELLRARLAEIAEATVFSPRLVPGDPLFDEYEVRPGENLIGIGRKYQTPSDSIMLINGIRDARQLRAGQRLKVPHGPFNVVISLGQHRLDVYLQDVFVRSFPVGLGADQSTPAGVWVVKERLPNPTYYPPASAKDKRIIPPNDPKNPLGEHWIGLKGIEGAAVGRDGYGIHGTIEPESIGKSASMGCVRMHNDDVAWVYALMMPGKSKVTIQP
jgi:lipoprotein-anchoring transpeptidase ErfK/SrfK